MLPVYRVSKLLTGFGSVVADLAIAMSEQKQAGGAGGAGGAGEVNLYYYPFVIRNS